MDNKVDLTRRAVLTSLEIEKYRDFPINKTILQDFMRNHPKDFNPEYTNLCVAPMLITAISQYSEKQQENVRFEDALLMKKSLDFFIEKIGRNSYHPIEDHSLLKRWRKSNNLSRFGYNQCDLLYKYVNDVCQ